MNQEKALEHVHKRSFRAMGCQMVVWLELENSEIAATLLQEAEAMFNEAERRLSRFDPSSELSRLNDRPGTWNRVSEMLWSVLKQALFLANETGGLYDPTQLMALEAAGYTRSFEQMPEEVFGAGTAASQFGQWQSVKQNARDLAIWLPPGLKIDLGGIAKGYAAHQVADFLSEWGPCLIDAGGDLTAGAAPWGLQGWPVAISAPFSFTEGETTELLSLWLVQGTMATSGIDYRRWQHNGHPAHHVIDPGTGLPADTDLLTATVLAKKAVRAEAWATAALVAGSDLAQQLLSSANLAAAFVDQQANLTLTPALAQFISREQLEMNQ
jgi:thiamine biosynthesis lipoprotein